MTIPKFLENTSLTYSEIARACGVNISQVYRWAGERPTIPNGAALAKLIALSGGLITSKDIPIRKRAKRSAA
jgi:transcriptional regulator with XRE-family HTH domain